MGCFLFIFIESVLKAIFIFLAMLKVAY